MFKKEAEDNKPPYAFCTLDTKCELWKDGFQKGAEFGYNKAKEDADKMKSRFLELCNLKDMRIAKLEKANEWHYVKDGDYPKEKGNYLVAWKRTHHVEEYGKWGFDVDLFNADEGYFEGVGDYVIAWKEIKLPTE